MTFILEQALRRGVHIYRKRGCFNTLKRVPDGLTPSTAGFYKSIRALLLYCRTANLSNSMRGRRSAKRHKFSLALAPAEWVTFRHISPIMGKKDGLARICLLPKKNCAKIHKKERAHHRLGRHPTAGVEFFQTSDIKNLEQCHEIYNAHLDLPDMAHIQGLGWKRPSNFDPHARPTLRMNRDRASQQGLGQVNANSPKVMIGTEFTTVETASRGPAPHP